MINKQRLHLGCGTVYLDNYINIDVHCDGHFLVSERPDLRESNRTTLKEYYKHDVTTDDILKGTLHSKEVVVDMFADINFLPFAPGTIDEIRLVQVFEHFSSVEADALLQYWYTLLKPNTGILHLDIPDLEGTAFGYCTANTKYQKEWFTRLLFGSQKNKFGIHKWMYTRETIAEKLEENGYVIKKYLPNIHFYPAFAVEAHRS